MAWEKDALERKADADFLTAYTLARYKKLTSHGSFVLNINSEWGAGKTFFITNWAEELGTSYPVIYFNAWETDYADDPLVAFIAQFGESLSEQVGRSQPAKRLLKESLDRARALVRPALPIALAAFAKAATGLSLDRLTEIKSEASAADDVAGDVVSAISADTLADYQSKRNQIAEFKIYARRFLKYLEEKLHKQTPVFVFIDELDRCRPSYAIELLENIKHIFDVEGLVFVVATDSGQLAESIKAVYGNGFDSERYLQRFFHQEYMLAAPEGRRFADVLFSEFGLNGQQLFSPLDSRLYGGADTAAELFALLASYFGLTLREQKQVMLTLSALCVADGRKVHLAFAMTLIFLRIRSRALFNVWLSDVSVSEKTKRMEEFLQQRPKLTYRTYIKTSDHASSQDEKALADIIRVYVDFYDMDAEKIDGQQRRSDSTINRIQQELSTHAPRERQPGVKYWHDLRTYPARITRAGQLT